MEGLSLSLNAILALILFTSFVKMLTVLSILRQGVGLGLGVGIAFAALALLLSALVVEPQLRKYGGLDGILSAKSSVNVSPSAAFGPFLERNTDPAVIERLSSIRARAKSSPNQSAALVEKSAAKAAPESAENPDSAAAQPVERATEKDSSLSFELLASAFLVTELKEAFELGVMILLPFLVLDLLVLNVLMALSITQLSYQVIALPLKILLFIQWMAGV